MPAKPQEYTKTARIAFVLHDEDLEMIDAAARAHRMSRGGYVRQAAILAAAEDTGAQLPGRAAALASSNRS